MIFADLLQVNLSVAITAWLLKGIVHRCWTSLLDVLLFMLDYDLVI